MSAQYRPYRDEVNDLNEVDQLAWSDNEQPGSIQIYEKTTEQLPFTTSRRRLSLTIIGLSLFILLIGFLIGFFGHSEHNKCVPNLSLSLNSIKDENILIKNKLLHLINGVYISNIIKNISQQSRIPGNKYDYALVDDIVKFFQDNHLDKIEIKNYTVTLPLPDIDNPNTVEVTMSHHIIYTSLVFKDLFFKRNNPYAAYSPPADITGDLVFVNYCRLPDLENLRKNFSIDFEGKILIAKQFHLSADEQLRNAQSVKAAGLLLYPDRDFIENTDGINFPHEMVRSDTVFWNGLGDPQTPGYPSTNGAYRLPLESLPILPTIPVQPISTETAYQLLDLMGGRQAPMKWNGLLNVTYRVGPGFQNKSLTLRIKINNKFEDKIIKNVIGYLKGSVEPDRYVIIGNHRDSWTKGAMDAASGTGVMFELIRVFGHLKMEENWRPRRTLIFASWGAEEFNLIGSTEWIEQNYHQLYSRAVAYVNIDIAVQGNSSISVSASPLLYNAIFNATKETLNPDRFAEEDGLPTVYDKWVKCFPLTRLSENLITPDEHKSTYNNDEGAYDYVEEAFEGSEIVDQKSDDKWSLFRNYLQSIKSKTRPTIKQLDMRGVYAPFFTLVGIPSLDISYVNLPNSTNNLFETSNPLIHTQFDTFENLIKIDPDFQYHRAIAQLYAEVIRDLSDSLFIPFNLFHYVQILRDYYHLIYHHISDSFIKNGIDLKLLNYAINNFTVAAVKFHQNQDSIDLRDPMSIRRINDQLLIIERAFLSSEGIPRNSMKKHIVLSPGEHSSRITEMFPGLLDELIILSSNYFDSSQSRNILQVHFSILVNTIQSAAIFLTDSIH